MPGNMPDLRFEETLVRLAANGSEPHTGGNLRQTRMITSCCNIVHNAAEDSQIRARVNPESD